MHANEKIVMDEACRLGNRFCQEADLNSAIQAALHDLTHAKDSHGSSPPDDRPTKMYAVDFLRLVAMVFPGRITSEIVDVFQKQFMEFNEASKIGVAQILAISNQRNTIPFLEGVVERMTDPKELAHQAAKEAIEVLKGGRDIGWGYRPGRWIYRIIKAQE